MTDNQNWLAEYVQTGSEAAFRELVTRYVDLVYSTALRLVGGDRHRAEDVAQTVFINLARVARTLPEDVKLGGWLHRDTCFAASTLMRGERRRQSRERQAAEMNALQNNSEADYSLVVPILDRAINELDEADRTAILLRFFEQQDFRSVGQALGSNEDAARMRVTRALEKLEAFLKGRGITTTATSLGAVLSANAVQSAPVGLALTISTAAALTGTTLTTAATVTATKAIAMTALQKALITTTIAAFAGAGIYEARQASQSRDQVQTLQQQLERSQHLQSERDDAIAQLAAFRNDNENLKQRSLEQAKLRGQQRIFDRTASATSTQPLDTSSSPQPKSSINELSKDSWTDAGFATPETALKTRGWAVLNGSRERFKESIFITDGARKALEDMFVQMAETSKAPDKAQYLQQILDNEFDVEEAILMPLMAENQNKNYTSYRILSQQSPSSDETILEVETQMAFAPATRETLKFRHIGNDWKIVIDEDFVNAAH